MTEPEISKTDSSRRFPAVEGSRDEFLELLREMRDALKAGGGGGNYGDMEARVAKLEAGVEHLERDVGELRVDIKDVRDRLISVEKTMATKGFVFSVYGIVSALLAAIILFQAQIQAIIGVTPPTP